MLSSTSSRIRMEVIVAVAAWALNSVAGYLPLQAGTFERSVSSNITADLSARLSSGARIYYPGSENFADATARWSSYEAPNFTIAVEVATENDVVETVKFANSNGKPFLAVNNGHGAITTVGKLQNGVEIWMHQLNSVKIAADGKTATFGGGIMSKGVTDGLWAAGKQTVTGICECVSVIGPGLGGGHGSLQGRHGLVADQFVSLNVVTADGKLTKVDKNHELWWAVRGAGHNFGIVTSITSKIYDVKRPQWAYVSYVFTGDKIEEVFTAVNEKLLKNGTQDVSIFNYSFLTFDASIDPVNAILIFYILQEGVNAVDTKFTAPFTALGPAVSDGAAGDYRDIPRWTANGAEQAACQKGLAALRFPIDLQVYDIPAQRQIYDLFTSTIQETPALNTSLALFEGYPVQGVQAVPAASTAYPFRESHLLVSPVMLFKEGSPELTQKAEALGTQMRDILLKASGQPNLRAYVNYALGNEGPKAWYGAEEWRQRKLKALKKKYDPKGKFSFYAPIV